MTTNERWRENEAQRKANAAKWAAAHHEPATVNKLPPRKRKARRPIPRVPRGAVPLTCSMCKHRIGWTKIPVVNMDTLECGDCHAPPRAAKPRDDLAAVARDLRARVKRMDALLDAKDGG